MFRTAPMITIVGSLLAIGCSDDPANTTATTGAGTGGDGGSSTSAPASSSSAGGGGRGGASPLETFASVSVETFSLDSITFLGATFGRYEPSPSPCTLVAETRDCRVEHCVFTDSSGSPLEIVDAGPVYLSGGTLDVSLSYIANYSLMLDELLYVGGETLTFHKEANDEVGAFSISLAAPNAVELTAPVLTDLVIDSTQSLELAWTPGSTGTLDLAALVGASDDLVYTTCHFDATGGVASLPAEILAHWPKGAAHGNIVISLSNQAVADVDGFGPVMATASASVTSATGADGTAMTFDFTVQ